MMKQFFTPALPLFSLLSVLGAQPATGAANAVPEKLRNRADAAMSSAVDYFLDSQDDKGAWANHPAVTALACTALAKSPRAEEEAVKTALDKGLDFTLSFRQPNGSIWVKGQEYPNYTTSIALLAMATVNREKDLEAMRAAREYLIDSQVKDIPEKNPYYGGIGYARRLRPDLNNAQWAYEALHASEFLAREPYAEREDAMKRTREMWARAEKFISSCQNRPESNPERKGMEAVASDKENHGGFLYMPGASPAGTTTYDDGKEVFNSYGSMTYAGVKSLIYAGVDKDDPRVLAALDWARRNYTFDHHPGLGQQGLYYYIHTLSKCLAAFGADQIKDVGGKMRNWRADVVRTLVEEQRKDGSWINEEAGRWMENVPELVTAYSLMALEYATLEVD
jgi:squalene-hopene/tetraprenyl-beta-curcumene cyclase